MSLDFTSVHRIDDGFISERSSKGAVHKIEALPGLWAISQIIIESGTVYIKHGEGEILLQSGTYYSYLPAYSIIEYGGECNLLRMITVSSESLFEGMGHEPVLFSTKVLPDVFSVERFKQLYLHRIAQQVIGREKNPLPFASMLKKSIDKEFMEPIKLADVAQCFKISQQLLTMHFKGQFWITPVQYRTVLRLLLALKLLLLSRGQKSISSVAFDVGYSDISQFNRQFKVYFGRTPSYYRKKELSHPSYL